MLNAWDKISLFNQFFVLLYLVVFKILSQKEKDKYKINKLIYSKMDTVKMADFNTNFVLEPESWKTKYRWEKRSGHHHD